MESFSSTEPAREGAGISAITPEVVLKLSELLSYILYDCNTETVSIEKEIKLLENYIMLEKLRYDEKLKIEFRTEGNTGNKRIAPLLILPLVENSFKHGVKPAMENPWIKAEIFVTQYDIKVDIRNSLAAESVNSVAKKQGIGIENLEKRLKLIYGSNYVFTREKTSDEYRVNLLLKLNNV